MECFLQTLSARAFMTFQKRKASGYNEFNMSVVQSHIFHYTLCSGGAVEYSQDLPEYGQRNRFRNYNTVVYEYDMDFQFVRNLKSTGVHGGSNKPSW